MEDPGHVPVLAEQVSDLLQPRQGRTCLDCTVGRGGHAAALIPRLGPGGTYVAVDLDAGNVAYAEARLKPLAEEAGVALIVDHASFAEASAVLARHEIAGVDVLLADLGFASTQVDDPARGLSFTADGPLDMRLDPQGPVTAAQLLAELGERELADVIYQYGEERLSRRIARKIVEHRRREPILTTRQLADLVRSAYGPAAKRSRIHPATRTFQALRIAVNGELEALDRLLAAVPAILRPGGRAAIISFHSLEDRRVKRAFQQHAAEGGFERLTRKPITADDSETATNPRSRSAKLRGLMKATDADR